MLKTWRNNFELRGRGGEYYNLTPRHMIKSDLKYERLCLQIYHILKVKISLVDHPVWAVEGNVHCALECYKNTQLLQ